AAPEPAAEVPAEPAPQVEPAAEVSAAETGASASDSVPDIPVAETAPEAVAESVPTASPPAQTAPTQPTPSPQSSSVPQTHSAHADSVKGNAAKKERVEEHLTKILALAQEKKTIACRDVVAHIYVSPATANRYLNKLVVRTKLKRSGRGR